MIGKIQLIVFCALIVALSICITIIVSMGFSLKDKADRNFDYGKIERLIQANNKIDKRFEKLRLLDGKDLYKEIQKEDKPFVNFNFEKKNYPIVIYKLDFPNIDQLMLLEYIEKEHAQIYNYCNYIIEK